MNFRELIDNSLRESKESDNQKNSRKEILQGYTISEQTIPKISEPYVFFKSEDGAAFSLNKSLLSRHILLLGGIGVGKTNTFNLFLSQLFEKPKEEMKDNERR